jgi:hypothetical protein
MIRAVGKGYMILKRIQSDESQDIPLQGDSSKVALP